ncbi:glycoside hydrolase N-terminal domain-containing protein, partial [Bacteroides caccae]|uniref:glycoside hydrolase N-terminal domain-containing protein n=2 Tax=Pseudomonadati TaxID=3379134 RepID=UPI001230BD8D
MFNFRPLFFLASGVFLHASVLHAEDGGGGWKSSRFWFSRPAEWKETRPQKGTGDTSWAKDATPIGNGRIGALIYGGLGKDHLE